MAMTNTPIFAQTPIVGIATLVTPTALTSRTNITGTTGLTQLTATSTNGTRVDRILVKASATSVATNLFIWIYNGTTSYLFDEIDITVITAANTIDSLLVYKDYSYLSLPSTYQLFVSVSIQQNLNIFALGGQY